MKLKKLLKNIPIKGIKGQKEIEIRGVCANSKLVGPGYLFIAKKGLTVNGAKYIPEAISAGAIAVVTDIYDPTLKNITQVITSNVNQIEGMIASQFADHPSKKLFLVGITGTNGKTTTSFIVKHILDTIIGPSGMTGTIEYVIGNHRHQATRTTPDVCTNHRMLADMVQEGCLSAVMEVTSHALDQGRVSQIDYNIGILTNFSQDHLDYHKTMENYLHAKKLLFKQNLKTAIVNSDCVWTPRIIEGFRGKVITYGINSEAHIQAKSITLTPTGTNFNLMYQGITLPCFFPMIGRFNISNCLAAIGVAIALKTPLESIPSIIRDCPPVPGRLEPVPNDLGLHIYVDFAHTPDALNNVLETLNEFKKGKMITIFGCGGDRDALKRPLMAQAAEKYSNLSIVTSDNPRSEEPEEIIHQILPGFSNPDQYIVVTDREEAISTAIEMANPEDFILIAGKGHEKHQIFAHKTIEFDDRFVAKGICKRSILAK